MYGVRPLPVVKNGENHPVDIVIRAVLVFAVDVDEFGTDQEPIKFAARFPDQVNKALVAFCHRRRQARNPARRCR